MKSTTTGQTQEFQQHEEDQKEQEEYRELFRKWLEGLKGSSDIILRTKSIAVFNRTTKMLKNSNQIIDVTVSSWGYLICVKLNKE